MQPKGKEKTISSLDEKIKKLDFATLIFSFIYFITFSTFYWIGNPWKYLQNRNIIN